MTTKITLNGLMKKFAETPELVLVSVGGALEKSAVEVQKTAVKKFGTYQPAVGDFEAWTVLSESTLREKIRAGAVADDPLIGHYANKKNSVYPTSLRQSIQIDVNKPKLVAYVGTNNPLGKWHEYGTPHIPPRPFLRPALFENQQKISELISLSVAEVLKGL